MGNKCPCCLKTAEEGADSVLNEQIRNSKNGKMREQKKSGKGAGPQSIYAKKDKQGGNGGPAEDYGLGDDTSIPLDSKYLKVTLEEAFADSHEDVFMGLIDNDQVLQFTVMLNNFKLQNFNLKEEVFIVTRIGPDYIEKEQTERRMEDRPMVERQVNCVLNSTNDSNEQRGEQITLISVSVDNINEKIEKIDRINEEYLNNATRWESKRVAFDTEGTTYIDEENNFKYAAKYGDIAKQCMIVELFSAAFPSRPFSILMIEFIALAIGPKHCDFEVKDLRMQKSYGRIQFDINIQQLEIMEVRMEELQVKLNGKEERPLFGSFKVITNKELPKTSDHSRTQKGKYKKEKNQTKLKWTFSDSEFMPSLDNIEDPDEINQEGPDSLVVEQEISLEGLKNSTIQLLLRVDTNFSEQMTEKVMSKIRKNRNFTFIDREPAPNKDNSKSNKQGDTQFNYQDVPSNGQDEQIKQGAINGSSSESRTHKIIQDLAKFNQTGSNTAQNKIDSTQQAKNSEEIHGIARSMQTQVNYLVYARNDGQYDASMGSNLSAKDKEKKAPQRISYELEDYNTLSKSFVGQKKRPNSGSFMKDARDYYRDYDDGSQQNPSLKQENTNRESVNILLTDDLVGECYVGFSKLMQSELRKQEKRNSNILQNRISNSNRLSNSVDKAHRPVSVFQPKPSTNNKNREDGMMMDISLNNRNLQRVKGDKKVFEEQFWFMGKLLGTVRGSFILSNLPVMQQMTIGVLTENGISMNVSPIYSGFDSSNLLSGLMKKGTKNNEKITLMIDMINKLKKLDQGSSNSRSSNNPSNKLLQQKNEYSKYNEKMTLLNTIIDLLIEDDRAMDGHMFKYVDELDLMRAQYAMIDLAFHCLLFVENVRYELKKEYYEILSQIFMRDELRLSNLALGSFMEEIDTKLRALREQKHQLIIQDDANNRAKSKNVSQSPQSAQIAQIDQEMVDLEKVRNEKFKIAIMYQKLLHQTLDDCLTKFTRKDVEPYLRSYLEICISVAFFRVPSFQVIFLNCIKEAEGNMNEDNEPVEISEWRHIDWDLDGDDWGGDLTASIISENVGIFKLFDWELQFFRHIPKSNASVQYAKELEDATRYIRHIEANKKWQARVKKRSLAYFQIIKRWAELLKNTVKTYSLLWQDIPGYRLIVKSLLLELKMRKVTEYPDSLIDACTALIENPQLLTVVTNIVFLRTNAYDSVSLCTTMGLLTKWITHLERLGLPFPSNFDLNFFMSGIKIALEMDHSVSTPRTMHLLFKTLHYFPVDQRATVIQEIFSQKLFYGLFFSWSYNIRDVFIAFLLYQVEYFFMIRITESMAAGQMFEFEEEKQANSNNKLNVEKSNTKLQEARNQRQEHLSKIDQQIKAIDGQITMNPQQAESDFEKSISGKRMRQTSDLTNQSIKINPRASLNPLISLYKKPQITRQQPSPFGRQIEESKKPQRIIDAPKPQQQGMTTVQQFVKTHKLFKKILAEVDLLEEYVTVKGTQITYDLTTTASVKFGINETNTSSSYQSKTQQSENQYPDFQSLERDAKKIIHKIPKGNQLYINLAINDFYKQVEEYQQWKTNTANFYLNGPQGDQIVISQILPEFNMEKNMPVEDDENLAKQEDW